MSTMTYNKKKQQQQNLVSTKTVYEPADPSAQVSVAWSALEYFYSPLDERKSITG